MFLPKGILFFVLSLLSNHLSAGLLYGIRLWSLPNDMRFVLDLSMDTKTQIFTLQNPERLVIDLNNTVNLSNGIETLDIKGSLVSNIRYAYHNERNFRIVLDLNESVSYNFFQLQPDESNSFRLVLNLKPKNSEKENKEKTSFENINNMKNKNTSDFKDIGNKEKEKLLQNNNKRKDIIVVIDPGHGGKDPGAISSDKKIYEKTITLSISRKIFTKINSLKGFKAYLTRNEDIFIPLKERMDIARKHKADLFISIHADAAPSRLAHGASIYALSPKGATSETAKFLADKENSSDLIGGILIDKDAMLAGILLDLSLNATIAASLDVGSHILKYLNKFVKLHKSKVEQAGFVVLKSPDIPSVLIEAGFISNNTESKRLTQDKHQINIVNSIVDGVVSFYKKTQPKNSIFASRAYSNLNIQNFSNLKTHTVKQGDTLHSISKKYNLKIESIKQKNNLKK